MGMMSRLLARLGIGKGRDEPRGAGEIDFPRLERALRYSIRDRHYFYQAFSHRSYLQVKGTPATVSNERLEFLGDAILNLVAAEFLFRRDENATEGDLTKLRARLVNRRALAIHAREIGLGDFMLMSPSALQLPGRGMESILADAYEAVIGAIYMDGGFEQAAAFVRSGLRVAVERGHLRTEDENFKSRLLELTQALGYGAPRYITVNEEGPDHDRTFTVEVMIGNRSYGSGDGKNKKDAEQAAAEKALLHFANKPQPDRGPDT